MDERKAHAIMGHFQGGYINSHQLEAPRYDTPPDLDPKPARIQPSFLQTTIHQEVENPDITVIPLWLTPTNGGMLKLDAPETGDHGLILCCIEAIDIRPSPDAMTKVEYTITIPHPFIDAFDAVFMNQPMTSPGILGKVGHTIMLTQAD